MLVLVTQVTPANGMPGLFSSEPEPIKFMDFTEDDLNNLFITHSIKLSGQESDINGVRYIDGTQRNDPIRLVCSSSPNTNTKNYAMQLYGDLWGSILTHNIDYKYEIVLPKERLTLPRGNTCYVLPRIKCTATYKIDSQITKGLLVDDIRYRVNMWRRIGEGLEILKKAGWYAHRDIENICIVKTGKGYNLYFVNFDRAIPVGKNIINVEDTNQVILRQVFYTLKDYLRVGFINAFKDRYNSNIAWRYNWRAMRAEEAISQLQALGGHRDLLHPLDNLLLTKDDK
ncbi:hypothetical protein BDF19DRAFT_468084 [Syncephalis fuscata]|nr:hypothetical protein BDF19DRAFT_468084 [Syncephalis fuscata]